MAKEKMYHIALDDYEHGIIIRSLNDEKTDLMNEGKSTDAVDDLCTETRNVGFYADLCANIRPRPCHHGKFVQAEQHGQRRAKTDEHIGAETGRTALASTLQTDAAAEQHRKGEPHYDRGEMKFAQVLYHSTHLM